MSHWDTTGRYFYFFFSGLSSKSYAMPATSIGLPKVPPTGLARIEKFADKKINAEIPRYVESPVSPSIYAYTRAHAPQSLPHSVAVSESAKMIPGSAAVKRSIAAGSNLRQ